jgi:hypothetical protein
MSHDSEIVRLADKVVLSGVSMAAGMKIAGGLSLSWWWIFSPYLALWGIAFFLWSSLRFAGYCIDRSEAAE